MSPQPDDDMIGRVLGDYKIQRLLGKGGMSQVYQASDQQLGRDVALKIITLQRDRAKELMKRFRREARTLSKLDTHPNIVTVYRYGTEDEDTHYLAMELIRGETLAQRLARHKRKKTYMPHGELLKVIGQIAAAIDHAHQNNVIHRDIKPSNIMIEKGTERAVLMDFGLVMDKVDETTLGTAFGTPRYISPEQAISSQQAVFQSDIYSLGIIVYEILTGQTPFDEDSAMSLALSHITNPPPPPQHFRPEIPDLVADVVLKALEKQPENRYQTAVAFIDALSAAFAEVSFDESAAQVVAAADEPDTPERKEVKPASKSRARGTHTPTEPPAPSPVISSPAPRVEAPRAASSAQKAVRPAKSKLRLVPVGVGLGTLLLIAAVLFSLFGSGDGAAKGDDSGRQSSNQGDEQVQLFYSNDHLTIYNASGHDLDLRGVQFFLPDRSMNFDTTLVGIQAINPFVAGGCIHVTYRGNDPPAPEFCTKVEPELHQRKNQQSYFWVWDSATSEVAEFIITLDEDTVLQTCRVTAQRCGFSLPEE